MNVVRRAASLTVALVCSASLVSAAPAAAATVIVVDQKSPLASDANTGTATKPVRTIQRGAALAEAANRLGTPATVLIAPGTYRETVSTSRAYNSTDAAITFEAAVPGTVVISGADIRQDWSSAGDGTWKTTWTANYGLAPIPDGWAAPFERMGVNDLIRRREMVFVGGRLLRQVLSVTELRATPESFFVDEGADRLTIRPPSGVDPTRATTEVATRGRLFQVNKWRNLTLRNLVFRHASTSFQSPAVAFHRVANVLVEGTRFEWNNWGGLKIGFSSGVTVLRSSADNNGVSGFDAFQSTDITLENTTNSYNAWRGAWSNYLGWDAGSKFMKTRRVVLRNHQAIGNHAHGIWFDTDNSNIRIERAFTARNRLNGINVEANQGPITITGTVSCRNQKSGIFDGHSNDVAVTDNRIFGNQWQQIRFSGDLYGRTITTYDTGQTHTIRSERWTINGNVFATEAGSQQIYRTTSGTDMWEYFRRSLTADRNTYWSTANSRPFELPLGRTVDLAGWRSHTGDDRSSGSTAPSTPLSCTAP